jgi:site-specific DNA-methyltransferase (adenine-specific)
VIWYYTFGVNCKNKFSRSHAHLLYFVKDPEQFTFNAHDPALRVPSARQLVYGDKRANPTGRLPDDTWIAEPLSRSHGSGLEVPPHTHEGWFLRPLDVPNGFAANSDTWYFPRVAGTFKERSGWHGCQMPERLLARIILSCSNAGDVVIDPFAGSGTTLAVATKLGRQWLGYDMSPDYAAKAESRLAGIRAGDPLDGAEDPLKSVPTTRNGKRLKPQAAE